MSELQNTGSTFTQHQRWFKHQGQYHEFYVIEASSPNTPSTPALNLGKPGWIYKGPDGVCYRTQDAWVIASKDTIVRHPEIKGKDGRVLDPDKMTWVSTSTLRMRRQRSPSSHGANSKRQGRSISPVPIGKRLRLPHPHPSQIERLQSLWSENDFSPLGLNVLETLSQMAGLTVETPQDHFPYTIQPTMTHVVEDLMSVGKKSRNCDALDYSGNFHVTVTPAEILSSLCQGCKSHRRLGALSIPSKGKSGIGSTNLCLPPGDYVPDQEGWSSSLVPGGAITPPHTDYHGERQAMYHISGLKLWFLWPATEENLTWYRCNTDKGEQTILGALKSLGLPKLLLVNDPCGFTLEPYAIHAVMTFNNSAHTGHRFWDASVFSVSMAGIRSDCERCRHREQYGMEIQEGSNILCGIEGALEMLKRLNLTPDEVKEVMDLQGEVKRLRTVYPKT